MTAVAAPPRSRLRAVDALQLGAAGMRTRRARTLLTALGIAIGIAAMAAVLGISASSRAEVIARLDRLGTNVLEVSAGQQLTGGAARLPDNAAARIRRVPPVESASSLTNLDMTVHKTGYIPDGETGGLGAKAVEPQLKATLGLEMAAGRFIDDANGRYPAAVLGSAAAEYLGITSLDGGPQVMVGDRPFTIVGILEPSELAPNLDHSVLIGYPTAKRETGASAAASTIYVRTDPDQVDDVRAVLAATANSEYPSEVEISRPSDALAARAVANETLTALLLGLGGVALLVGGIGIANVMVISVLERRTEIGLRRAVGATRRHILVQFLLEAGLLAGLGGAVGVALGAAITAAYSTDRGWPVTIPAVSIAGGIVVALAIGLASGMYPAIRAARMAPAGALQTSI